MPNPNLEVATPGSDVNLSANYAQGQEAAAQEAKNTTVWEGMKAAGRLDTLTYALIHQNQARPLDPDYKVQDDWKRLTDGIPMEFHQNFLNAQSAPDGDRIKETILGELKDKQTLSNLGGTGTALHLGAALLDPVALGAFALTGPLGHSNSASILARMAKGGLVTGATVGGVEAGLVAGQETKPVSDIWHGAAFGGVLGAAVGAFSKPVADQVVSTLGRGQADATLAGAERTAAGEAELSRIRRETHEATGGVTRSSLEELKVAPHSNPESVDAARAHVDSAFGKEGLAAQMEGSGKVKFVSTEADLPKEVRNPKGTNAFYDPHTDTTFLVADRMDASNSRGLILHEVGVHQSLKNVVGEDLYKKMISEVDRLAKSGDVAAVKAIERAESSGAKEAHVVAEEKLGYYLEHLGDIKTGLVRDVIAKTKAYLKERFGIDVNLNKADIVSLVNGSVKSLANESPLGIGSRGLSESVRFSVGNSTVSSVPQVGNNLTHVTIPFTNIKVPLRMDLWAILQKGEFKELGEKLFANAVGGSGVMEQTAAEHAEMLFRRTEGQWRNHVNTGYQAWLKDTNPTLGQRALGNTWREFNKQAYDAKLGVPGNYHPGVLQAVAGAEKLEKELLDLAKQHGVQGADNVDAVKTYVTRRFDHDATTTLMQKIGDVVQGPQAAQNAIHSLISRAIQKARRADPP